MIVFQSESTPVLTPRLFSQRARGGLRKWTHLMVAGLATAISVVFPAAQDVRTSAAADNSLVIINAAVVDGTGSPGRTTSITIRSGVIEALGDPPSAEAQIFDAQDMTLLPGLIDSHVHFQAVPGAVHRKDDYETRRALMYQHLRAHVANGVTTVLDAAINASVLREIRMYLADRGVGPRVMALGPTFHNPDGYMDGEALSDYWAPRWRASGKPEDVDALYREYDGISDLVGVKVAATHGFGGPFDIYDTHTPEMLSVIRNRANEHGRPIYVHVNDNRGVDIALGLGAHALAHLVSDDPKKERLGQLVRSGMHVIPTLYTAEHLVMRYQPTLLDVPSIRLTVPIVEQRTAREPIVWDEYVKRLTLIGAPYLPEWYAGWWGNVYFTEERVRSRVQDLQDNLMGIEDLVGTIEVGKHADLIVVRGNPFESISSLRELEWIMKDGEMRRPSEWMSD